MSDERKIVAAKADKYIGRDGGDPRAMARNADVGRLARFILDGAAHGEVHSMLDVLGRITDLPRSTVRSLGRDYHPTTAGPGGRRGDRG